MTCRGGARTASFRPFKFTFSRRGSLADRTMARLQVLAAALLFSTGGAAVKATTLTAWQVAGFRSGIAALAVFLLVPAARRGWTWHVVPVGVAYAATLVLFVTANKLTTAANAIFLQASAPLYMLAFGPLLLREPVRQIGRASCREGVQRAVGALA